MLNTDASPPKPDKTPQKPTGAAKRIMLYFIIALIVYYASLFALQRKLVFPRWAITVPQQADPPGPGAEVWQLDTPAGPVEGWFLAGDGVSEQTPGPAVIFAHGNGELIDHCSYDLQPYRRMGVSVLLAEFRGYGRSAGSPSQKAIVADFVAFYDRLIQRPQVDAKRIVFHGRSLGGGVAACLASQREPAALILQSSFTSTIPLARRYLLPRPLILDPFDVKAVLSEFDKPVLILHGDRDQIIPLAHAQKNHAAAKNSRLILYPTDHNNPPPYKQYWQDIEAFLLEADIITPGQPQSGRR